MTIALICPHDHHLLVEHSTHFACTHCNRNYQITDGVVCTLDKPDEFYEGAYENQTRYVPRSEKPWHVWPLWLTNGGYVWMVRKFVPKGDTVVELGCAGGVRYFGQRYHMIGCDLSLASLKKLDFYERSVQADAAACIGLPDNSVDAVVSSYFWEHIPPEIKPKILKECHRVLKPGGKLVFLYDVETENPLIRKFKQTDIQLYKTLFIDGDGHLGYQTPGDNLFLYKQVGFQVLKHQGLEKTWLQSPSTYEKLARFGTFSNSVLGWAAGLGRQPFFYPYTALMRMVDTLLCPWLPDRWSRVSMAVCIK